MVERQRRKQSAAGSYFAYQPRLGTFAEFALQIQDVPEPASVLLAGAGLLAFWLGRSRKYDCN
jgi:hypothetical protein